MNDLAVREKPLVLGIGNLLMGDEGVGVAAIRRLEQTGLGRDAELMDGGTGGFHLLGLFRDRRHVILIDAAADGWPTGTVSLTQPRYASDFPPTLTAHDIGLKDLIESAALLDEMPEADLITISIGTLSSMTIDLSPAVAAALPKVEALVKACLARQPEGSFPGSRRGPRAKTANFDQDAAVATPDLAATR